MVLSRTGCLSRTTFTAADLDYADRALRNGSFRSGHRDLTPNFRAAFRVSLGQTKDPDYERQKTYDRG